uniref:Uncharacterized protein n=1 Tax=Siphoviridae sp. ct1yA16 TaxID=2827767 RepID=A0A8S5TG29_9CAUD|nr:MAG TPA: hypothetical protein [Siphoviridae sp. ct1yA16]
MFPFLPNFLGIINLHFQIFFIKHLKMEFSLYIIQM